MTAGGVIVHVLGWGSLGMVLVVSIWMLLPERRAEGRDADHSPDAAPLHKDDLL